MDNIDRRTILTILFFLFRHYILFKRGYTSTANKDIIPYVLFTKIKDIKAYNDNHNIIAFICLFKLPLAEYIDSILITAIELKSAGKAITFISITNIHF